MGWMGWMEKNSAPPFSEPAIIPFLGELVSGQPVRLRP